MFKHILFDLDGTLTESHEGIVKSIAYALKKEGKSTDGRLNKEIVIGPPLMVTITKTYGFPEKKARRLYDYFQERYGTIGLFENKPYPGIGELLQFLRQRGRNLYIATSKPQVHALSICDRFGFLPYLTEICGAETGGSEDKARIIGNVLNKIGDYKKAEVVMTGDRKFDVLGARKNGIAVINVGFGYGSEAERREYVPDYYAPTVDALQHILLGEKEEN